MADYFNLTVKGLGYINGIKEVSGDNQDSFWVCDLSALRGPVDNASYTYFDCIITGKKALELLKKLKPNSEAKQKILIGFELGNLKAVPFMFEKGSKQGQAGVNLTAHLLFIQWIKIASVEVYNAKPKNNADQATAQQSTDPVPESVDG
ncbi:MAG: DUF3577 domain-containing protein [Methylococcales bacterium]